MFETVNVNLKSLASIRASELQLPNIVVKPADDVTAVVTKAGTAARLLQVLNIAFMVITAAVLNSGTVCRLEQLLNIPPMFVTEAVLNNGTVCRLEQL